MRYLVGICALASIGLAVFWGWELRESSLIKTEMQYDQAEITKINYGLFNIQLWKEKALDIFEKKIHEFEISEDTYDKLGDQVEAYLYRMYDEWFVSGALAREIENNLEASGKVPKFFMKVIKDNLGDQLKQLNIKSRIPGMVSSLSLEIKRNEPELKKYLQEELLRLLLEDNQQEVMEKRMGIFQKYDQTALESTLSYLEQSLEQHTNRINDRIKWIFLSLGAALIILLVGRKWLLFRELIVGFTLISVVLLILGVTMPMIDLDARMNSFDINILGEDISFEEQSLLFQSKSILDVTRTLMEGNGIDLKLVGVLIFLFSIVFPFSKLILSTLYLYWERIANSQLAKTIIFYLGKWSMADVFVVAMFMAYIGFFGLVTAQLGQIDRNETGYVVETVNYTKLAPGALFFTCYCLLSIITSLMINRKEVKSVD